MAFKAWWDPANNRLCWSGRSDLYANAMGTPFTGSSRNHVIPHGAAMRMLVNRINEAYHNDTGNRFPLQQNLDLILAAIGIMVANLPSTGLGPEIRDARRKILYNVGPNGCVNQICSGVETLEELILNCPYNMWYGFSDVNSQIGDCLDLPAHTITCTMLQPGTMVRWNYDAPAIPLSSPAVVRYPIRRSQSDLAVRNLVNGTDWKDYEIQIMGGLFDQYGNQNLCFFLISSTDLNYLNTKRLRDSGDDCSFGIEVANPVTYTSEWFLFQKTSKFTYTAIR